MQILLKNILKFHSKVEFLLSVFTFDCVQLHFGKHSKSVSVFTQNPHVNKAVNNSINNHIKSINKNTGKKETVTALQTHLNIEIQTQKGQRKISESKRASRLLCVPLLSVVHHDLAFNKCKCVSLHLLIITYKNCVRFPPQSLCFHKSLW